MNNISLLNLIKDKLSEKFENLIVKIILFGSRIDGTAHEYSDYDVLVVVNRIINWQERDSIRSVVYDLNIKYDIQISVQFISEPELSTILGRQPFIQNAIETGITV